MIPARADAASPEPVLRSDRPVLLVGGGPVGADDITEALRFARDAVAADGGAAALGAAGILPRAVIGDMDSLDPGLRDRLAPELLHPVTEQDSTDFEKCLTRIAAPLVLAAGFGAGRIDHLLAVLNAMVRHADRRCVLLGPEDAGVVLPPALELPLPHGATVSLFPMAPVAVSGDGLNWPVAGLPFRPDGQIGTSNRAIGPVSLQADRPGMLLFVARAHLDLLLAGLDGAPRW